MPDEPTQVQQGPTQEQFDLLMSRVQQVAHSVDSVNQRTAWLPTPQQQAAPQPTNIFADPDRAIGERIAAANAPLLNLTVRNTVQMARSHAANDPRVAIVFQHWPHEVDAKMGQWHIAPHLEAANWVEAAKSVLVDHLEDIKNLKARENATFLEGRGNGRGEPSAEDNWQPDEAFLQVAKNMGEPIDLQAFAARRAKILDRQRRSA